MPCSCTVASRCAPRETLTLESNLTGKAAAVPPLSVQRVCHPAQAFLAEVIAAFSRAVDEVSQVPHLCRCLGEHTRCDARALVFRLEGWLAPFAGLCLVSLGRDAVKEHIPARRYKLRVEREGESELRKVWGFNFAFAVGKPVKSPEPW